MIDRSPSLRIATAAARLVLGMSSPAGAAEQGRKLDADVCSKWHGLITEQRIGQRYRNLPVPVVMVPVGPNTGLLPAGSVPRIWPRYSRSRLRAQ